MGVAGLETGASARTQRMMYSAMPLMAVVPSPTLQKRRLVYDAHERRWPLPGTLVREEGQAASNDAAADEAYDYAGVTYDFYR
jgi:Zn-dependent metalloprotease